LQEDAPGAVYTTVAVAHEVVFCRITVQEVESDAETPPGMTVTACEVVNDDEWAVETTFEVRVGDETHVT